MKFILVNLPFWEELKAALVYEQSFVCHNYDYMAMYKALALRLHVYYSIYV